MYRCTEVKGKYKVSFKFLVRPYGDIELQEEYIAPIGQHEPVYGEVNGVRKLVEDIPRISNKESGKIFELCQHEYDWMRTLPGLEYNLCYRYTWEEVK